eukprot:TRINITY_DN12242_c0_g1_i3.p2 TRINITY_DN12242_c0_g1~~TRINITY_DN12242_c0_g1_i3.p2  ORF type:complete len:181 (-),score=70.65 TRINITY_DN12242_c0_g1_i3:89-631(-)
MPPIYEKLVANNTLKCLDLSMNKLQAEGIKLLAKAVRKNTSLELLGVGSMDLTIEELEPLLMEFGRVRITEEEGKELEAKIAARDAIVEKNKKVKGKKQEPVPVVNSLEKDDDNNYYEIRKPNFKQLSIGYNKLDESALEALDKLMERTSEKLVVTVPSKYLDNKLYVDSLAKYNARIIY